MLAQSLVVALIVIACAVYAAWTLMGGAARRSVATALLKLPLPDALAAMMRKHSVATSGCSCLGCDLGAKKTTTPTVEIIRLHPRPPR